MLDNKLEIKDAAGFIGCTMRQLMHWDVTGVLAASRNKRRRRVYGEAQLVAFMKDHPRYKKTVERSPYEEQFTTTLAGKVLGFSVKTIENKARAGLIEHSMSKSRIIFTRQQLQAFAERAGIVCQWPNDETVLLTVNRAAAYLGVGSWMVRKWTEGWMGVKRGDQYHEAILKSSQSTPSGRPLYSKLELQCFSMDHRDLVPRSHAWSELKRNDEAKAVEEEF